MLGELIGDLALDGSLDDEESLGDRREGGDDNTCTTSRAADATRSATSVFNDGRPDDADDDDEESTMTGADGTGTGTMSVEDVSDDEEDIANRARVFDDRR
jgi:hypothetical protein